MHPGGARRQTRADAPKGDEDVNDPYRVFVTNNFENVYFSLPDSSIDKVRNAMELLKRLPYLGRDLNSLPGIPHPRFPCRRLLVPKTHYLLIYEIDEADHSINFLRLVDSRQNPDGLWI